ncbi:MAG: HAD family phosphatase [Sedimentisphaerales bacterium]|jgi:beta-phosphoglucomutase family hydrolase|nr:HAD family phosphatase [Sedimentisphaerales bacterium]HNY79496.1 HAD family phosphatase [Sedimentisphaerales bacterium]HOC62372.1 HAD family phosphatase [Sedimentisphaerales bacterium]HOH65478.1 HAD family phosphatase [Sedimentisphaerales bacterium]HPY51326.1 HAD family phosphatase [Sedimentisphaerales bacterium]
MAWSNYDKGVIFDMDGVLVDSGWAHRQAWFDLAEAEGLEMSDEFFCKTFGMQNDTILPMLRPGISKPEMDRLSDRKEQRYRELVHSRPKAADGVLALLSDLKADGFRLAIGSSAPRANLDVFWGPLGLADYFQATVTKEQVVEGKPSPETFLKAAGMLSLAPQRCVVVEDALHGVQAARAAGMPVVAVTTTRSRAELACADRVVDSLAELSAEDFVRLLNREP